jgi:hypothetical protein
MIHFHGTPPLNILHGRFVTERVERANFFILTVRARAGKYGCQPLRHRT